MVVCADSLSKDLMALQRQIIILVGRLNDDARELVLAIILTDALDQLLVRTIQVCSLFQRQVKSRMRLTHITVDIILGNG
jgi:hypothetical protein